MQLTYAVKNTMRAIGARTSSAIVRRKDPKPLLPDHLTIQLRGSAGQSLAAFSVQGVRIELTGDANDYVGKGLSGATVIVKPPVWRPGQALIGNTVLYGATSGRLFAAGVAGERFAVRNSGATAVVEGVGVHGCEYMTGGVVAILGPVGWNFAAGMTGGRAFVYDPEGALKVRLNGETVGVSPVHGEAAELLRALVEEHGRETGSPRAAELLEDWAGALKAFVEVAPLAAPAKAERKRA
jgi:glutamate synthase (NADPH/NADH) large chain